MFAISKHIFYYTRCITPKRVTSWRGPISASLRPGNTTPFEEMSQRWRTVGNTVSDLTNKDCNRLIWFPSTLWTVVVSEKTLHVYFPLKLNCLVFKCRNGPADNRSGNKTKKEHSALETSNICISWLKKIVRWKKTVAAHWYISILTDWIDNLQVLKHYFCSSVGCGALRKSQMRIESSCELLMIWNSSNWRRNTRPECSWKTKTSSHYYVTKTCGIYTFMVL